MSKHQEYCCSCKYDNPENYCYLGACHNCEMGFQEWLDDWWPSNYEEDDYEIPALACQVDD